MIITLGNHFTLFFPNKHTPLNICFHQKTVKFPWQCLFKHKETQRQTWASKWFHSCSCALSFKKVGVDFFLYDWVLQSLYGCPWETNTLLCIFCLVLGMHQYKLNSLLFWRLSIFSGVCILYFCNWTMTTGNYRAFCENITKRDELSSSNFSQYSLKMKMRVTILKLQIS